MHIVKLVYTMENLRPRASIVEFLITNPNKHMQSLGEAIVRNYIPLDFEKIMTSRNKTSLTRERSDLSARSSVRKTNYINFHGQEFDENQNFTKSSLDIIEDEIQRLTQKYTESSRVIWSSENTDQVFQTINEICENEPEKMEVLKMTCFDNPLMKEEFIVDGIILRCFNWNFEKSLMKDYDHFIHALFTSLSENYLEYIKACAFINILNGVKADITEELPDIKYPKINSYQNSISDEVESDHIDQYIEDQSQYENRIVKILTTLLVIMSSSQSKEVIKQTSNFLNPNFMSSDSYKSCMSSTNSMKVYKGSVSSNATQKDQTKGPISPKSVINNELDKEFEVGFLNMLDAPSSLIRCTLIQLLYIKAYRINRDFIIDHSKKLIIGHDIMNQTIEKDALQARVIQNSLELQLLSGLVLKIMLNLQENITLYKNHEIEILLEIHRKTAVLVLNNNNEDFDERQTIFVLKSEDLEFEMSAINEFTENYINQQPSDCLLKSNESQTLMLSKSRDKVFKYERRLESHLVEAPDIGDIETGINSSSKNQLFKIKLPILSELGFYN